MSNHGNLYTRNLYGKLKLYFYYNHKPQKMSADFSSHVRMRSTTPSQQDRLLQIRGALSEILKSGKTDFSFQDLQEFLTQKSGKTFDPTLLDEIFINVSLQKTSKITIEDFVTGYYQAETALKSQIDMLKKQIRDESIKVTQTRRQYIEAKANKIPEDDNVLTVIVKKTDIKSQKQLVVRVICDDWEVTTNPVIGSLGVWEETFTFNPVSNSDLLVELWEHEKMKNIACLGKISIPLLMLKDEDPHEENFKLVDKTRVAGFLHMIVQWVQVKIDYLERLLTHYEGLLTKQRKQLEALETRHDDLMMPFTANSPSWFIYSPRFKKAELHLAKQLDDFTKKTFGEEVRWPRALKISIFLYVFLSLLTTFLRPDFFNVIII